jgi:hypothetical protein
MFLSDPVNAEPKDKDKKGWGIWGWGKKAGRKGSVSSLAPSVAASVAVEDDEWRRGDGGSAPSYRAIFLATVSVLTLS